VKPQSSMDNPAADMREPDQNAYTADNASPIAVAALRTRDRLLARELFMTSTPSRRCQICGPSGKFAENYL